MKKLVLSAILFGVLATGVSIALGGWDGRAPVADAQVAFRVIDTEGNPVGNALIKHCFHNNQTPDKERLVEKYTGTTGCVIFEGETSGGLTYRAQKDGYYSSDGKYTEWQEKWTLPDSPNIKEGRWQPWNPTFDVVLKKIKNPVPMYVKGVEVLLPKPNQAFGYDLEKGDLVAPYGNGTVSDLVFKVTGYYNDWKDYDGILTLQFSNEKDGIQPFEKVLTAGSMLHSDYFAPESGYFPDWKWHKSRKQLEDSRAAIVDTRCDNRNYYFRVRTILDEQGDVKSALYGKIYGDLNFGGASEDGSFLKISAYYINPTPNDRNIEFDPEKNLFGGRDRFAP
jgi:hypothetical protein